jgi:hypothetical protein
MSADASADIFGYRADYPKTSAIYPQSSAKIEKTNAIFLPVF